ncbi:hypothetical protein CPB83DRAFT_200763 [Crepidotus variabilis]|uniref:Uncharacterized protein n=1 Tax=Crepidotus variabilis TaxID=179855 RepID=A0A9P6EJ77_9AGAR|nr:hypothetical protein CPB83DRAFT_200763 [Crepidotus variabilis]
MDVQLFVLGEILSGGTGGIRALPTLHLEELDLTVRNDSKPKPNSSDAATNDPSKSTSTLLPYFLTSLSLTLSSLSLKTIGHIELDFFRLFPTFPNLRAFSLHTPLDAAHLRDPASLREFLDNHPKVEKLGMRYAVCERCPKVAEDGFVVSERDENGRGTERHLVFTGVSMPALKSLELGLALPLPPPSSSSSLPSSRLSTLSAISTLPHTLTSLSLHDRSLSLFEARLVFRSFHGCARLKKLSFFAKKMTPQLVDLVSRCCPVLSTWNVDVGGFAGFEGDSEEGNGNGQISKTSTSDEGLDAFTSALISHSIDPFTEEWRYRTWTLSSIRIMKWEFGVGHVEAKEAMNAIADVVPSVILSTSSSSTIASLSNANNNYNLNNPRSATFSTFGGNDRMSHFEERRGWADDVNAHIASAGGYHTGPGRSQNWQGLRSPGVLKLPVRQPRRLVENRAKRGKRGGTGF